MAPPLATTAARKATSAENATPLRKRRHATVVVKPAISHANVPNQVAAAEAVAWAEAIAAVEVEVEVKSATNVAR